MKRCQIGKWEVPSERESGRSGSLGLRRLQTLGGVTQLRSFSSLGKGERGELPFGGMLWGSK